MARNLDIPSLLMFLLLFFVWAGLCAGVLFGIFRSEGRKVYTAHLWPGSFAFVCMCVRGIIPYRYWTDKSMMHFFVPCKKNPYVCAVLEVRAVRAIRAI